MKEGLTLTGLMERLQTDKARMKDYVVDTREIGVLTTSGPDDQTRTEIVIPAGIFEPTLHFLRQLGGDLGVRADLFDRLRSKHPEHFDHLINGLLARWGADHGGKAGKRLFRTYVDGGGEDGAQGIARAMMSDQYRRIDNYDIALAVMPVISKIPGVKVPSCDVTETKMYLKVVAPGVEVDLNDLRRNYDMEALRRQYGPHHIFRDGDGPDGIQAGFVLTNSEVGSGALDIKDLVYRVVCSNGLIGQSLVRRAHLGGRITADEAGIAYRNETLAADDKALMMKVQDAVASAVDEVRFQQIAAQFAEASTGTQIEKPIEAMKELAPTVGLNDAESNAVLQHLLAGGDLSRFGLVNAITRAAQDVESYDRSTELEELGGDVLRYSPKQWDGLVAAA